MRFGRRGSKRNTSTFYTLSEIADLLCISESTVYRFAKSGELLCYKMGSVIRFRREDLSEYLAKRRAATNRRDSGNATEAAGPAAASRSRDPGERL